MIESFADLMLAISKGELEQDLATHCDYLVSFDWRGNEAGCYFLPGSFQSCIGKKKHEPLPTWLTENIIAIIAAFSDKGAYGSVIALLKALHESQGYEDTCNMLITHITADSNSTPSKLTPQAYNYIYLAAVYVDLIAVWKHLLSNNLAELNYQTAGCRAAAVHYAVKFSSHKGCMEFLEFAHATGKFNPNLQGKFRNTALLHAANGLYFSKSLSIETKNFEIATLLRYGANVFITSGREDNNTSALSEVWRVANQFGAETLLLQYGAGLVQLKHRALNDRLTYSCNLQAECDRLEKLVPGFNYNQYINADVVLVGKNKTTGKLVWLYGMADVYAALRDPNIEIYREQIAKQLQNVDPSILGSVLVLPAFLNCSAVINAYWHNRSKSAATVETVDLTAATAATTTLQTTSEPTCTLG